MNSTEKSTYSETEKQAAIAKAGTRKRKRLNVPFLNIQEMGSVIVTILGNFQQRYSKTWDADFITVDVKTEDGEVNAVVLDGGLRGALKLAGIITGDVETTDEGKTIKAMSLTVVKPGLLIEIEFAGKIEVASGKANQYNIYELEN